MPTNLTTKPGIGMAACIVLLALTQPALAQQAKEIQITHRGKQFRPAKVRVPAKTPLTLRIKNLDKEPIEFESDALHVEAVINGNGEGTVSVQALAPGRYEFFDYFNQKTRGFLVAK
jgi:hypothetical protein